MANLSRVESRSIGYLKRMVVGGSLLFDPFDYIIRVLLFDITNESITIVADDFGSSALGRPLL